MYINDIHIAYYAIAIIASIVIGQLVDWANKRMPEYKKIVSKDIINEYKIEFKPNYILILVIAIIYVTLLYNYGIKPTLIANLDLIKYLIISPMLVSAFVIDYKHQIIPNRLNLTLFEIGIIFAFLYGLSDVAITFNLLLGMVTGGGIFLLITVIGGIIYGKEAMGFGDVKLMAALGLLFGLSNIIIIIFNRSYIKCITINYKNQKIKWIYTIWTIYSNRNIYKYVCTIWNNKKHFNEHFYIRTL